VYKFRGFTVIELTVIMSVVVMILAMAVPSFTEYLDRRRLESATETIYTQLKHAHAQSLRKRVTVYASFNPGATWCLGLSDSRSCNCTISNDCQLDSVENVIQGTSQKIDSLAVSGMSLAGGIGTLQIDGVRGTLTNAGSLTLSRNNKTVVLTMNVAGLINRCSTSISSYPSC
jgi:Tfp pilus assembly protein FimT